MKRVVVLLSGTGSNLQAILNEAKGGQLGFEVVLVVSNRRNAGGLEKASAAGVPNACLEPRSFATRGAFDRALAEVVDSVEPDLIVLAGFMRILSPFFVRRYNRKIVNIHPSLLPAFPGKDAQAQAIEAGVTTSGVTVHYVDEGVDTGPIIEQMPVSVSPSDTAETLSAKIQAVEHKLYPRVIAEICREMGDNQTTNPSSGGQHQ